MAIKKGKTFSPYSYGIKYRVLGRNPNIKYSYVPAAGGAGNEPLYVISKKAPNYFSYITNIWKFNVLKTGEVEFINCKSEISISGRRSPQLYSVFDNDDSGIKSSIIKIKKKYISSNYQWIDSNVFKVFHSFIGLVDLVIILNNEYYNDLCKVSKSNGCFCVDLEKREIFDSDEIIVIVYQISSLTKEDENFVLKKINELVRIDNNLSENILIKNEFGNIDFKYLVFNTKNIQYKLESFNVEPSYIEFSKNDVLTEDMIDIGNIYAYSPKKSIETFVVQYGINTDGISWDGDSVKISHNLNSYVNFILDRNDSRKMIKSIKILDLNNIKIDFFKNKYLPNVFTFTVFKICEDNNVK